MIYPFQILRAEGALTPAVREAFVERFGKRGADAFDAAAAHRVKRYKDYFVVLGNHDNYCVEDGVCSCPAALHGRDCWHKLAVEIAVEAGMCDIFDSWYYLGGVKEDVASYTPKSL
ncbi:MAG TPA: SWIM zinc finger family protein [Methanocorpusculum sp.]|nr:SWIM zinc finger family protein [Methanocorpusculum sp.]